jgi:hypothetical protein
MVKIPDAIDATVDRSEDDENAAIGERLVPAVDAQGNVKGYCENILCAVEEMDALAIRVPVPADALQSTPYTG